MIADSGNQGLYWEGGSWYREICDFWGLEGEGHRSSKAGKLKFSGDCGKEVVLISDLWKVFMCGMVVGGGGMTHMWHQNSLNIYTLLLVPLSLSGSHSLLFFEQISIRLWTVILIRKGGFFSIPSLGSLGLICFILVWIVSFKNWWTIYVWEIRSEKYFS